MNGAAVAVACEILDQVRIGKKAAVAVLGNGKLGRLVAQVLHVNGAAAIDTAPIVVNEVTLVGSRCGRFEAALPLIEKGKLRLDEMISDRYPLSEAPAAFARVARKGVLKVLLTND